MKKNMDINNLKKTISHTINDNNKKSKNSLLEKIIFITPIVVLVAAVAFTVFHVVFKSKNSVDITTELYNAYSNENAFKNRVYGEEQTPNMENDATAPDEELPISVYGDSFCVSAKAEIPSFSAYLSKYCNARLVYNVAAPGDTIETVAARTGGVPMYVSACDIKKDKADIEILLSNSYGTKIVPDISKNAGLNPCKINGVEGVISVKDKKVYFSRSKSGFENIITDPAPVITRAMDMRLGDITIIFVGNDKLYSDMPKVLEIYQHIIDNLKTDKYLIIGPVVGNSEEIKNANLALEEKFGNKYFDLFDYLCSYTPTDSEIALPQSEVEKALGKVEIPDTYLLDKSPNAQKEGEKNKRDYFTEQANDIIGKALSEKLNDLGYLK